MAFKLSASGERNTERNMIAFGPYCKKWNAMTKKSGGLLPKRNRMLRNYFFLQKKALLKMHISRAICSNFLSLFLPWSGNIKRYEVGKFLVRQNRPLLELLAPRRTHGRTDTVLKNHFVKTRSQYL